MANLQQDSSTPHARGNALSSAVHEINNPLEALLNLLYLVECDTGLSEPSRQHLRMATAEVTRISHIAQTAMKQFPASGCDRNGRRGSCRFSPGATLRKAQVHGNLSGAALLRECHAGGVSRADATGIEQLAA
jgi:hypothetical protein